MELSWLRFCFGLLQIWCGIWGTISWEDEVEGDFVLVSVLKAMNYDICQITEA